LASSGITSEGIKWKIDTVMHGLCGKNIKAIFHQGRRVWLCDIAALSLVLAVLCNWRLVWLSHNLLLH